MIIFFLLLLHSKDVYLVQPLERKPVVRQVYCCSYRNNPKEVTMLLNETVKSTDSSEPTFLFRNQTS